jgi:transcriptional/translational regulatory protein YebC/TACO1
LRIRDEEDPEEGQGQEAAQPETNALSEDTAGWVDEETVAKLDRLASALEEEADCTRIWSNLYGWP